MRRNNFNNKENNQQLTFIHIFTRMHRDTQTCYTYVDLCTHIIITITTHNVNNEQIQTTATLNANTATINKIWIQAIPHRLHRSTEHPITKVQRCSARRSATAHSHSQCRLAIVGSSISGWPSDQKQDPRPPTRDIETPVDHDYGRENEDPPQE